MNTAMPPRLLVLDADIVPALAVTRSLVRRGYHIDVASAQNKPIAGYSRKVSARFRYPNPLRDEAAFLEWMSTHLDSHRYDLVIPVSERSLVPLSRHRERFRATPIAMAEASSLERVLNKADTFRLAESLGVPVPHSAYLQTLDELPALLPTLSYPVVIKPSRSVSAGTTGYHKQNVSYASSEQSLRSQCEQMLRQSELILQSYFKGDGVGIELIANEGEILYPFQHIRLREVPLTGGGSCFRASMEIEPALLDAASRLIRALNWTGVAMVEFKRNPDNGSFCLMEINGRFWGSLPLALASRADFPAMLAELHLTGKVSPQPDYLRGIYCRNLASDLSWLEAVLRERKRNNPLIRLPSTRQILRDQLRVFSYAHAFDTQSVRDPRPGLVDTGRILARYWQRLKGLLQERRFARRQRRLWRSGQVSDSFRQAEKVLFICYGNINRSALAHHLLASLLPPEAGKTIRSAGFHPQAGRPADERMQAIAAADNIDLSHARSSCVDADMLADSDIIFVMEKRHYDEVVALLPSAADHTFLLGPGCQAAGRGPIEIPDPYNRPEAVYRSCCTSIQQAITQLVGTTTPGHGR